MTLQEQLDSIKAKAVAVITPQVAAAMKESFDELRNAKVLDHVLKVGDTAPAFLLPNGEDRLIGSENLLQHGPLVVHFFRGKW
jgi:hypothetical protein